MGDFQKDLRGFLTLLDETKKNYKGIFYRVCTGTPIGVPVARLLSGESNLL